MANFTFEDIVSGALSVVGIALIVNDIHKSYEKAQRLAAQKEAIQWGNETKARMRAMNMHAMRNGISREAHAEMIAAAKNRIICESYAHENTFVRHEAEEITAMLDGFAKAA